MEEKTGKNTSETISPILFDLTKKLSIQSNKLFKYSSGNYPQDLKRISKESKEIQITAQKIIKRC